MQANRWEKPRVLEHWKASGFRLSQEQDPIILTQHPKTFFATKNGTRWAAFQITLYFHSDGTIRQYSVSLNIEPG